MSKLEALKAAFAAKATGTGGGDDSWKKFYSFWKMPEGSTAIVRFLPDADQDNPLGFLVENKVHELYVNGERKTVGCLEMHGESCPICDLSRKYYSEAEDAKKVGDTAEQLRLSGLGKKYYRKLSYIGQVIVVESPIEHDAAQVVKLIDFGPKIFKLIQAAFQSGDLEIEPYDLKGGYNFRIKKTKSGDYADYGTSSFAPKQTAIEDDVLGGIELFDLKNYRKASSSVTEVEALLNASLTGAPALVATPAAVAPAQTTSIPAPAAAPAAPVAKTIEEAPATEATPAEAAPASSGDVLAQLRARAKAKAATAE